MATYSGKIGSGEVFVDISPDMLQATIQITTENPQEKFTIEEISQVLEEAGVTYGILQDVLQNIVEKGQYNKSIVIAKAKLPEDAKDGWFEFLFDTDTAYKPKILRDGSVDYSSYGDMQIVKEGEKIVIYHPAGKGVDGVDVKGGVIASRSGKELAKLPGRGFHISEDRTIYTAATQGKVSYVHDRLLVSEVLEIPGDVSHATGSVSFVGDIHVRGNVLTGMKVVSKKGSITVDGYVEAAELSAKKDVVLKNGMQGGGKGTIHSGGEVSAKFFEQVKVKAAHSVNANAIMNSEITAGDDVIVSGRLGIIIGGTVEAGRRIEATIIGNSAEVKTILYAGKKGDLFAMVLHIDKEIGKIEEELKKIAEGVAKLEEIIAANPDPDLHQKRLQLMRAKIDKDAKVAELCNDKDEVLVDIDKSNQARVRAVKRIFPGTHIRICGIPVEVKDENQDVEFMKRGTGVIMYHPD